MGLKEDMVIVAITEELEQDSCLTNYASRNRPHLCKWRRDRKSTPSGGNMMTHLWGSRRACLAESIREINSFPQQISIDHFSLH